MNRRELLKTLATALPAASISVEAAIQPSDLIVIRARGILDDTDRRNIETSARHAFGDALSDRPTILVLDDEATLTVERNIARVQIPVERT